MPESSEIQPSVENTLQILRKNKSFLNYPEDIQAQIAENILADPKAYILRALHHINAQFLNKNPQTIEAKQHFELLYLIAVKFSHDTWLTREVGKCYTSICYIPTEEVQTRILTILAA